METPAPMRFGIFLAPFHPDDENPTEQLHRDLRLVEHLEALGFHEAWIGEHHSGGYEIIASPELFIAHAAARTQRIRLGTGVVSLPYHHPLLVADRILQLDHQTHGRVMLGMGPGQLPTDAFMLGIDVSQQRRMMLEAIEVLDPLLRGETVTRVTDYELFSRYAMPAVNRSNRNRGASLDWAHSNSPQFIGAMMGAIGGAIAQHEVERAERGGEGTAWVPGK